jgi:hypothetical protein
MHATRFSTREQAPAPQSAPSTPSQPPKLAPCHHKKVMSTTQDATYTLPNVNQSWPSQPEIATEDSDDISTTV